MHSYFSKDIHIIELLIDRLSWSKSEQCVLKRQVVEKREICDVQEDREQSLGVRREFNIQKWKPHY
jgi:hypothetical protein